jgi:hypothetical protein
MNDGRFVAHSFHMPPPPDYTQQTVKLRLFIGVAAVILLLAVVERAFDPRTRNWFRNLNDSSTSEKLDNRVDTPRHRTAFDPPGTIVALADAKSVAEVSKPGDPIDPVNRAWQQGWKDVVFRLPTTDQSLLFELLHLALHRRSLPPEKTTPAQALTERINQLWKDYQATAFNSLADLKGDDQAQWIDVLRQVNDRYENEARPALQSAIAGASLAENHSAALAALQKTLVALAQDEIEDDTVVFRPAEREIWFHHLARVQDSAEPQLPKPTAHRVAYLQLHKQPANYRGKWVTVTGTARLAYRVPAPPNYLGIQDYVVYWLHPAGGPDSPILVYALAAPKNFPLSESGARAERQKIREDIQITGIFFKRAAYAAQGGIYTAPLLIAHTPEWRPAPIAIAKQSMPFTALQFAAVALATLLIAISITVVLWSRTARRPRPT